RKLEKEKNPKSPEKTEKEITLLIAGIPHSHSAFRSSGAAVGGESSSSSSVAVRCSAPPATSRGPEAQRHSRLAMRKHQSPCFQIGQLAEARTFEQGYRGAWFRCKIKRVIKKKGQVASYAVEYYDYPEDPEEKIKLYGFPLERKRGQKAKRELMLRPQFPSFYHESELPDLNTVGEDIVAVADVWRVGDLVDWFSDGCYWSGTITEVLDDDGVKVALLEPPKGEGSSYVVNCKDLRPTLDWSPEFAPLSKSVTSDIHNNKQNLKVTPRSSLDFKQSISSHTSVSSLPLLSESTHSKDSLQQSKDLCTKGMEKTLGVDVDMDVGCSAVGKHSSSDNVSGTYVRDVSAEVPIASCAEEQDHSNGSAKKMRLSETINLNSSTCDSIDSAILDLEELVNRVKWLKQILKLGIPSTPQGPTWEFLEHPAVAAPE
ncbi:DUF724 domain-containing protein 10, partial [Bienertia sinuspersici]